MYKIIGADQKEYGPVTSDQIRQWIVDGRVNGQTQAQAEGAQEWQPLSAFPEFSQALGIEAPVGTPPPLAPQADGRETALRWIKAPAIALMAAAILDIILALLDLVKTIVAPSSLKDFQSLLQQINNPQVRETATKVIQLFIGPLGIVGVLFNLLMGALILLGAIKMRSLRSYEFSVTAAIISIIPCLTPCCGNVFGIAFGIWALIVLLKPEVKACFH